MAFIEQCLLRSCATYAHDRFVTYNNRLHKTDCLCDIHFVLDGRCDGYYLANDIICDIAADNEFEYGKIQEVIARIEKQSNSAHRLTLAYHAESDGCVGWDMQVMAHEDEMYFRGRWLALKDVLNFIDKHM